MIVPINTCCQKELTSIKFKPFLNNPIIITPQKTPKTVPLPPKKLAPPIIHAAIASSSAFNPSLGYPESVLPPKINAPNPANNPPSQ